MSQPSSAAVPSPSPLLVALQTLLAAHRPAFRQERVYRRTTALVFASLFAFARHTITQLLCTLGLTDADWSAWYRLFSTPRVDYDALSAQFVRETLAQIPADGPYVSVVDGVQLPRSSQRMPGTSWLKAPRTPAWKPGIHRAQRYLHLAALLPRTAAGSSRALPLRWAPAFPATAVPARTPPRSEGQAAADELRWLRQQLDAAGRTAQRLLVLADGGFAGAPLWNDLPERTTLVARCAKNRALYALPGVPTAPRRGARRRYGERAPTPPSWFRERTGWQRDTVPVRGRDIPLRYRVAGPYLLRKAAGRPLFLIVVAGTDRPRRRLRREPSYWLVNAVADATDWTLPLPARDLLAWAWQRWEIEVCHRELKAGFGLGEVQSWQSTATEVAAQWQSWAYAVLVLAGVRAWGLSGSPLRPPGRWWRGAERWSLGTLWRGYRHALWDVGEFRALYTPTTGDWWTKADQLAALAHAASAAQRA